MKSSDETKSSDENINVVIFDELDIPIDVACVDDEDDLFARPGHRSSMSARTSRERPRASTPTQRKFSGDSAIQRQRINRSASAYVPFYTNLVLEGGGVLGIAYVAALKELQHKGVLQNMRNFAGASVGGIIAGALACRATPKFLEKIMETLDFSRFVDYGSTVIAAYNLLKHKGVCGTEYFQQWYRQVLKILTGNSDITMIQLHNKYGGLLVLSSVNISKRRLERHDYKSDPDTPLWQLVDMGMRISGLMIPAKYKGDYHVDAGLLENYPIGAFHYDEPDSDKINPYTLGMMLVADGDFKSDWPQPKTFTQYFAAHLQCMWYEPQKMYMDEQDWKRTIKIPVGSISSVNFNLAQDQIDALKDNGRNAVRNYFDGARQHVRFATAPPRTHTRLDDFAHGAGFISPRLDADSVKAITKSDEKVTDQEIQELKDFLLQDINGEK